jgi:hypothetical protein
MHFSRPCRQNEIASDLFVRWARPEFVLRLESGDYVLFGLFNLLNQPSHRTDERR